MNRGSCLCESVTYRISTAPSDCCYCYCSVCRKLSGGAMGAYGTVRRDQFEWTSGEGLLKTYAQTEQSNGLFCSNCGSYVLSCHDLAPDYLYLSLGCLDSDQGIEIKYQQFTASKADWVKLDAAVEQYERFPKWIVKKYMKSS